MSWVSKRGAAFLEFRIGLLHVSNAGLRSIECLVFIRAMHAQTDQNKTFVYRSYNEWDLLQSSAIPSKTHIIGFARRKY